MMRKWIMVGMLGATMGGGTGWPADRTASLEFVETPALTEAVRGAVERTVQAHAGIGLRAEDLAVTLVDLAEPDRPRRGSHRGGTPVYPASVVKLFHLVAAHRWLEDGRLEDTAELRRALRDMIVDSSNDATHYVIDLLTGTTSGPELPEAELREWGVKRESVNRYFAALGYREVNANKKPWNDGPYGRETQAMRELPHPRNRLTTDETARLLAEIATGRAVSPERSGQMLELLARDLPGGLQRPEDQARFLGPALPPGSKLWSKAGWTSQVRHDAALIQLPDGRRLVLVVFMVGHAHEEGVLHHLAGAVLEQFPTAGDQG